MSQDTHMFSVRRQRETLGGLNPNAVSAIPMPSSAMKRSNSGQNLAGAYNNSQHARSMSGSRLSLMPGRPQQPVFQRSSSGVGYDNAPMSAQRGGSTALFGQAGQSARRSTMAPSGMSASTPARNMLATPANAQASLQRRSSCYSARPSNGSNARQSFFSTAPTPAGVPQDPRRLRDINVRSQMANELLNYFTNNNFELEAQISLTNKSLSSPTQKEFNVMFQWLYKRIDPGYRFMKSMDAEIPPLLKQLHYPFEKSITKSQIAAVGGNNWHTFLGLLHWIMQLAQMMDGYARGDFDNVETGHDVTGDRIIFDFLTNAYQDWLNVPDNADEDAADQVIQHHVERMAAQFKEVHKDLLDDVDILEAEKKALMEQIEELERGPVKGRELDERLGMLKEDTDKHEEWCGKVESKIRKYQDKITRLEDEVKKVDVETDEVKTEKKGYQEAISQQGITVQDLDRMSSETDRLEASRRATRERLDETKIKMSEKELETSKQLDDLERAVEKYNSLGDKVGIIPASAVNAKGNDYELALTIKDASAEFAASQQLGRSQTLESAETRLLRDSTNGYLPYQLLNLDLKGAVKNNILTLRKVVRERRDRALEEDMKNHEMLDGVKEAMDEKRAEVEGLEHRLHAAEEELERTKEITTAQKMGLDAQVEKMEKELGRLRGGMAESVQMMEQREINTNLEYEQLTLRGAALREELHTEVEKMLNEVIKFKIHIQTGLENYEQFVDEEVGREYESLQREEEEQEAAQIAAEKAANGVSPSEEEGDADAGAGTDVDMKDE